MKKTLTALITLVFLIPHAHAQTVFTNGIDVDGTYVFGNGMITLESTTNTQTDAATRDIAPSVGQMAGVEPDTGNDISENGDLLTLKPKKLDLTDTSNREFVVSASQITGDGSVIVSHSASDIVISLDENNVQIEGDAEVSGDMEANTITLDGTTRSTWPEGDDLGNHTATENLNINGHSVINAHIMECTDLDVEDNVPQVDLKSASGQDVNIDFFEGGINKWLLGTDASEDVFRLYDRQNGKTRIVVEESTGNIGIGTSDPLAGFKLDVHGAGIAIRNVGGSDNVKIMRFGEAGDDEFELQGMFAGYGSTGNKLKIRSLWTDNIIVMRGDGNVGFGVPNPSADIDVAGIVKANSLNISGTVEANTVEADSINIGNQNTVSGSGSSAQGYNCQATGDKSHAEGVYTYASGDDGAHAEGTYTHANGDSSHAEGDTTFVMSSANASHVEGYICQTDGHASHAEGDYCWARSHASHAEGYWNEAHGGESHAAGRYALAEHDNTYVWSDGGADGTTIISSTDEKQFTVHAGNGIRLLGGSTEIVPAGDISMGTYTNRP